MKGMSGAKGSAHEMSRTIFRLRRMGCLEAVGPAVSGAVLEERWRADDQGMNAMQGLVQSMTDQLGAMERM